jgi:HEAT repeat protein
MRSIRFVIGFTVFLFVVVLSQGSARAGNGELLLARLQLYAPELRMENIEKPYGVSDKAFVRALSNVATNLTEDWHIRIAAIRVLGATDDPAATDALMTSLLDFCPAIRWNAANALGGFSDDPRVVEALIAALHSDTLYIREAATRSLGRIRSRSAVPHLIGELDSRSFALKSSAIVSLGEIGDTDAVPSLKRVSEQDADALLRSEAVSALKKIEEKQKRL